MMRRTEDRVFVGLLLIATLAFFWLASTFFDAILWAVVGAIMFAPVQRRLLAWRPDMPNSMAALTLLMLIGIVIIPMMVIGSLLIQEVTIVYQGIQSGKIDFAHYFNQVQNALPGWASRQLDRFGLNNIEAIRDKLGAGLSASFQTLASQAFNIGQQAFSFFVSLGVMLYLTFFLLRDGRRLSGMISDAVPLRPEQRRSLFEKFITVVRATVKGNMVVAIVQGGLGGLIFWLLGIGGAILWAVSMAFMSLIPALGSGIVWVPVAIYLFATGAIGKGIILILFGVLVIGMVDNVLRPILVGRDTRMPDYIVLISTLGGLELFGLSGFVMGPVIAALFIAVWESFISTRRHGQVDEERRA
jgi:predicted PurR-regulated permease PerM